MAAWGDCVYDLVTDDARMDMSHNPHAFGPAMSEDRPTRAECEADERELGSGTA